MICVAGLWFDLLHVAARHAGTLSSRGRHQYSGRIGGQGRVWWCVEGLAHRTQRRSKVRAHAFLMTQGRHWFGVYEDSEHFMCVWSWEIKSQGKVRNWNLESVATLLYWNLVGLLLIKPIERHKYHRSWAITVGWILLFHSSRFGCLIFFFLSFP